MWRTGNTNPVLIYQPHVRGDGFCVIWLCFYLSDLVQVQLCQLKLLLALGDLGVKVYQPLEFITIKNGQSNPEQIRERTRTRTCMLIVDVSTVDPHPDGIILTSRTTSTDLQPLVSVAITSL